MDVNKMWNHIKGLLGMINHSPYLSFIFSCINAEGYIEQCECCWKIGLIHIQYLPVLFALKFKVIHIASIRLSTLFEIGQFPLVGIFIRK